MTAVASDDLDLNVGDPGRGDSRAEQRRRRRQTRTEETAPKEGFTEREVRAHLDRAFDGLAKNRDKSGDTDLAEAIREEGDAMTEGFVALTENVKPLRMPLVIILNILITVLAFGRVGGILFERWAARRERRAQERAMQENPGAVAFTEE